MEIQINSHKPDNTTHVGQGAPQVTIIHDAVKESGWVLPHPSAIFHVYASMDTPWVA
jgi:hypothetical protein